jgi:hypothetical protein
MAVHLPIKTGEVFGFFIKSPRNAVFFMHSAIAAPLQIPYISKPVLLFFVVQLEQSALPIAAG